MEHEKHIPKETLRLNDIGDAIDKLAPDMEGRFDALGIEDLGKLIAGLEELKTTAKNAIDDHKATKEPGQEAKRRAQVAIEMVGNLGINISELKRRFEAED